MSEETSSPSPVIGQLIILNGTSSAGKSSIARALQMKLGGGFLHVGMDTFLQGLPNFGDPRRQSVIDERLNILADAVGKHLKCRDVILDAVFWRNNVAVYEKYHPYLVAIQPSLEVLEAREKARGDRHIGTAESQFATLHQGISYDLKIDNSWLTAEQATDIIIEAYKQARPYPTFPVPVKSKFNPNGQPAR